MSLHNTKNIAYFTSKTKNKASDTSQSSNEQYLEQFLDTLAKQSMKERVPTLEELEKILWNTLEIAKDKRSEYDDILEADNPDGSLPITKFLRNQGYLRDKKQWLTHKGFFEIGNKILKDVMKDLSVADFGLHETKFFGQGSVTIDSTKKYELGDNIKNLSVSDTLLNTIQRISKNNTSISFPLDMELDDFEQYESLEDVRVAVVYCIDLSSTMKTHLGQNGQSRIEAAKKALWGLYVLNRKFFPNDSIFIVGFASLASVVNPFDIPFLKTYGANDNFLHYTNYQAALRLARKLLKQTSAKNKRIVMITDGQPSACFVENEYQKNEIIREKPYSNFYLPDNQILSKIKQERNMTLDSDPSRLVYLCYRYKKVDPKIDGRTMVEAKKCLHDEIHIDTIVISDEYELLDYVQKIEKILKGKTYHIDDENMNKVLVTDYLTNTRKVINSRPKW